MPAVQTAARSSASRSGAGSPVIGAVTGQQAEHGGAGGLARGDAGRRVLDDEAVGRRHTEALGRQQVRVRRRLAERHLIGSDQHRRRDQAGHRQPRSGDGQRPAGHDGQPVRRHVSRSAAPGSASVPSVSVASSSSSSAARAGTSASGSSSAISRSGPPVGAGQHGGRFQAVLGGERRPVPLHRTGRVDEHPVEVGQDGRGLQHVDARCVASTTLRPVRASPCAARRQARRTVRPHRSRFDAYEQRPLGQPLDEAGAPLDGGHGLVHGQVEVFHLDQAPSR